MGSKRNFWKGVIVGAVAMLMMFLFVGGASVGVRSLWNMYRPSTGDEETYDSKIISDETLKKLEEIQAIINRDYLYVDDIDNIIGKNTAEHAVFTDTLFGDLNPLQSGKPIAA